MRRPLLLAVILSCSWLATGCDKAGTKTPTEAGGYRIVPATYGEHSNASEEAQTKCEFDEELTAAVAEAAAGAKAGDGKVLTMVITRMRGAEAAWEGEISVIVEGQLESHGDIVGNFRVQRRALGGVGGGMPGVCRGLDDIAELIAEDVAGWLAKPGTDSELGGKETWTTRDPLP